MGKEQKEWYATRVEFWRAEVARRSQALATLEQSIAAAKHLSDLGHAETSGLIAIQPYQGGS